MESDRFDNFARSLRIVSSRRQSLLGLVGAVLGLGAIGEAQSGRRRARKGHRRRRREGVLVCHKGRTLVVPRVAARELVDRGGQPGRCGSRVDPGTETCAGSNGCGNVRCGPNSNCFCRIAQETGDVFCGGSAYDVLNCGQCGVNETCVDLSACNGGVGCAPACATH